MAAPVNSAGTETLAAIRRLFEGKDESALAGRLRPDVVLKPPTYWKAWTGERYVSRLLVYAARNLEHLHYSRQLSDGEVHGLYFEADVGGLNMAGIDLVRLDAAGLICEFEIIARPPNAVQALSQRMGASIAADPVFAKPG